MNKIKIIKQTECYVRDTLDKESTGHDWWHVDRVRRLGIYIAKKENADVFTVELASLLHDIADWKFHNGNEDAGPKTAAIWLKSLDVPETIITTVGDIIKSITFKGANVKTPRLSLEGQVVQDADRLDALGAIGIARVFAFGGYSGREIHNPTVMPLYHSSFKEYQANKSTAINHFHEKLLLLRDRMNTATAQLIAAKRHQYMLDFLQQFAKEWSFPIDPD